MESIEKRKWILRAEFYSHEDYDYDEDYIRYNTVQKSVREVF